MIQHTVAFRLNDPADESGLLVSAAELGAIPGVRDFEILRQVSQKNDYTHALSMYFASEVDYDAYNNHPDHVGFVENVWIPRVAEFIELDYVTT